MKRKPKGKPFKRGHDPRRHKLTRQDRSRGGQRTFQKLIAGVPPFDDPAVFNYVSYRIAAFYGKRSSPLFDADGERKEVS